MARGVGSIRTKAALVLLALSSMGCASAPAVQEPPRAEPVAHAARPVARSSARQHTRLQLPFRGTWIVVQGYHGAETHHGRAAFALDFTKVDERGRAHVGRGRRVQDWYAFGAEVLASAAGVVVRVVDRFPDNPVMGTSTEVNRIIVRHREAEFSEYVHLQRGSARVRVGERVERGQLIARAGNSGSETPHLHLALLSSIAPIRTRPAVFSGFEIGDRQGNWRPASGTPRSGELIRQR